MNPVVYISLLRGINISGHHIIKMADLKALYESLGFKQVITYIQSGNVVFRYEGREAAGSVNAMIEQAIQGAYGFKIDGILRTAGEMIRIRSGNPLLHLTGNHKNTHYVTFLGDQPDPAWVDDLRSADVSPDQFTVSGREVYVFCPNGFGNTRIPNDYFGKKLKVRATSRNWNTVCILADMAEGLSK